MNFLLSAKTGDVTAWRAVEDFVAAYRQAVLDRAVSDLGGSVESVFSETLATVESAITTHRKLVKHLESLIEEASTAQPIRLKELMITFYGDLYRHFDIFRSAPAFYQLSMAFLRAASAAIIARAAGHFGPVAGDLPEIALIAVGPAGRSEYSPFCPLQLLLVHGKADATQLQSIDQLCHALHAELEAAGMTLDPVITPRNPRWRGTVAEWRQRCEKGLQSEEDKELIDLCRLVDQYPLYPAEGFGRELAQISIAAVSGNRYALKKLVERMTSLSNGLSLIGRLKLERSGRDRGMFRLLDHGLLPLSAALSALALIKRSAAVGNCDRVRDLLKRGELDVELAERMLSTWHSLNDLRLRREQSFYLDEPASGTACLNPNELTADQLQSLKESLESVAIIQRHVDIIFSGMGE